MASKPAIKINSEITPAKMGRSTKNLDMFMVSLPANGPKNKFENSCENKSNARENSELTDEFGEHRCRTPMQLITKTIGIKCACCY